MVSTDGTEERDRITSEGIDAVRVEDQHRVMTTTMLSRTQVANGCLSEYDAFASLVEGLSETQWNAGARCAGWQVRDVAGHVIGLAEDTAAGVPGTRNSEEEAASVRHESAIGAAARLRVALATLHALFEAVDDEIWAGPSGVPDLTLGEGVLTFWYDTYVHADDIRAAIGRESERGDGLEATIAYLAAQLTKKSWGPATLALAGIDRYDVNGGGPAITGDPLQFALAATGRIDPATIGLAADVNIY